MRLRRTAGDTDNRTAGIHIPVRSAQTYESRYDINAAVVFHFLGNPFGVRSGVYHANAVTEPLDSGTSYEDGTFESVFNFAIKTPSDGRYEAILGFVNFRTRVHEHEAASAVGVLSHARLEAVLAKECCLLVTSSASNRNRSTEDGRNGFAIYTGRRFNFRQHALRNIEITEECVIPFEFVDVVEHRTGSVGVIRHMSLAAREFPNQPGINGTKEQVALFCLFAGTFHLVENPFDFRSGEISVNQKTSLVLNLIHKAFFLQVFSNGSRLAGLPNDSIVHRTARVLIPYNRSFALVGDTDSSDIAGD